MAWDKIFMSLHFSIHKNQVHFKSKRLYGFELWKFLLENYYIDENTFYLQVTKIIRAYFTNLISTSCKILSNTYYTKTTYVMHVEKILLC